jgi:hypothetical protein
VAAFFTPAGRVKVFDFRIKRIEPCKKRTNRFYSAGCELDKPLNGRAVRSDPGRLSQAAPLRLAMVFARVLGLGSLSQHGGTNEKLMIKQNIITYATTVGGLFLIAIGLLGFWLPGLWGMHLGVFVNLAHLGSGALALYWGLNSRSLASLRVFCLGLGVFYGLASLAGFAFAGPGGIHSMLSGDLGFPRLDHAMHFILGAGFIWAGMAQPRVMNPVETGSPS